MKLAAIQIRGGIMMSSEIKDTLNLLKLTRKNSCVVVDNNPIYLGMLVKLKDFITWGEIDKDTLKNLLEKRGKLAANKHLTSEYLKDKVRMDLDAFADAFMNGKIKLKNVPGLKNYFRLKPPVHGFERKGIKKQFSLGGALGYRGKNINELIRRML